MSFRASRLRGAEWLLGGAGVALLVVMFAIDWYGLHSAYSRITTALGFPVGFDAWQSLHVIRFLLLVIGLGAVLAWWLQATRAAPALPVCATVIVLALSGLGLVLMIWRVLDPPGTSLIETRAGAYVGLGLTAAVALGGYLSLRQDQGPVDEPVETLRLAPGPRA